MYETLEAWDQVMPEPAAAREDAAKGTDWTPPPRAEILTKGSILKRPRKKGAPV
jgi:hypothetical protein